MFGKILATPVIVVLLDLWWGLILNVTQSLKAPTTSAPKLLPTVPDMAFNWLQVMVNAGMVITLTLSLVVLLQLNTTISRQQRFVMGPFRVLGLCLTLAFSLPALYGLIMALWQLLQGHWVISLENVRYLLTALCLVWCAVLCLWRLMTWWRMRRKSYPQPI